VRTAPVHFNVGVPGQKPEDEGPKPNRRQRRAQAKQQRKEAKKQRKRLEARARKRFEQYRRQLVVDEAEVAEEYKMR